MQTEQAERAEAGQAELQKALSDVASQHNLGSFQPLLELSKAQHDLHKAQQSNQFFERCASIDVRAWVLRVLQILKLNHSGEPNDSVSWH